MNINELKVQLSNNGINNATFNFNGDTQSGNEQAQQQQNRHNEQKANKEYNYFENEEENEEILSSLEIIIPQYG
jgi:flagellar hook-length control protein FliK